MAKTIKKSNQEKRLYNMPDAVMLTAAGVVVENALDNKVFLLGKRSNWKDPFLTDLQKRINDGFRNILGLNQFKESNRLSADLYMAIDEVKPKLASFKKQVEIDFEDDQREKQILDSLGFKLFDKIRNNSQQALIELLSTFDKNLTPELMKEITDAGTEEAYMTDIRKYATILIDKNITQENSKSTKKELTAEGIIELNKIYALVMKVSKTAAALYEEKKDSLMVEKFTMEKIKNNITGGKRSSKKNGGSDDKPE